MANFIFGMNQSLDGYVDHTAFEPGPKLFRHFIEQTRGLAGSLYGRKLYEIMSYWDNEDPTWTDDLKEFGAVWRAQPKWVVSRTLKEVGPNATLIDGDAETLKRLKSEHDGDIDVGGTVLAQHVGELGLMDAYRIYLHPVVVGSGTKFFAGPLPRLRLTRSEEMAEGVVKLTYAPA